MKPTHKPVYSYKNGEYSTMAFGFASGFDKKMSEPWVLRILLNRTPIGSTRTNAD